MSKDRDLTSLRQELDSIQNLNASFREQLERTHKENSTLTDDNTYLRKKISSLQQENNNSHNECLRLESELYQQGQEVERLKKENVGFLKNKREVERKLREETQAFEKDRIVWQERELELIDQVKALQETVSVLAQQNEQASKRNEDSPPDTPNLGPSHYITVREVKNAQRTIKELEKRNNEITAELDKAKQATTESMNLNKNHVRRIQQLETELSQVKHMHQSLMEENEAFQLLLHEKTMKGEFVLNPIMQRNDSYSEKKNTDIVEKVTNGASKDVKSSSKDNDNLGIFKDSYLAAELNRASVLSTSLLGERVHKESDHTIIESKLQEEIKSLKDANKSMRLYIEKILNRILEAQGFEELLSSEWVKPPASPVTPVTGSFSFNNNNNNPVQEENKSKKIERRKTLSGWHFRSTSQPQNNIKNDTIISEEPEQYLTLRKSNEDTVPSLSDAPRRPQRRNSSSTKNTKRFSLFGGWGSATKEEEKKDDPYMRPMILVQGQGKDRKE